MCGCPAPITDYSLCQNIVLRDESPCPVCCAVEKINALAELEVSFWLISDQIEWGGIWCAHWAYIEAADIVMEEFDA